MAAALIDQVAVDIAPPDGGVTLRATGSTVAFDGFLALYHEDTDDPEDDEEGRRLPPLNERDALARGAVDPLQHFTQPPPRYSEASLVKKLEELGIGRPSTYASILQVLQDRNYVRLDKKRFVPEDRGRLVTAFLTAFFERYVEYGFTADLENQLDDISGGRIAWKQVLEDFWRDFSAAVGGTKDLNITQVIATLDEVLGRHFFPDPGNGHDPRLCPGCQSRPARPEARPLRRLHRLLELSRIAATRGPSASRARTAPMAASSSARASSARSGKRRCR